MQPASFAQALTEDRSRRVRGGGLELIALWGEVGAAATTVELEQDGVTTSRSLAGAPGWVVVCGAVRTGYRARVRDASGRVLTEEVAPPEDR